MLDDIFWCGAWDAEDHVVGICSGMDFLAASEGGFFVNYEEVHSGPDLV